jgi:hypothetical protein
MKRALKIGLTLTVAFGGSVSASDWPQWRGPHGSGVSDERDLPVRWSATENLSWKADLGGVGVSSPIVAGDRVFVTSQIALESPVRPASRAGASAQTAGERSDSSRAASDRTYFLVERSVAWTAALADRVEAAVHRQRFTTSTTSQARVRSPTVRWYARVRNRPDRRPT